MKKNVVLIIRDGWGINPNPEKNAVFNAHTPNIDSYLNKYPNTVIQAAGEYVGLPKGYQGSSEVGHLNMGAGRIVKQEITRINESMEDGSFFRSTNFQNAINNCKNNNSVLHVMGLVQDEGVHAHQDHLFGIMKYAAKQDIKNMYIHFFSDGRDTPPRSSQNFLRILNNKIEELKIGKIGTLMGRYYAMDRGKQWNLIDKAYNALTKCEGIKVKTAEEAITNAYNNYKLPNGDDMFDEYIPPTIIGDYPGIKDGDSVIHFNYRQDRAIELTNAFIEDDYPGNRDRKLNIVYCGLTKYYDSFNFNILDALDKGSSMHNLLGEIIDNAGLTQLRISETQKFKHVTSFFNGKKIEPYKNEDRIELKGRFDPASFAEHPEMEAFLIKDKIIEQIKLNKYNLIVINFANGDMVGHTGVYESAVKAIEIVDKCVGEVVDAILEVDGTALITADHGNAEEMIDYKTGLVKTAHTTNPVELIYIAKNYKNVELKENGILSDLAPTILYLLGIDQPSDMTSENMIKT